MDDYTRWQRELFQQMHDLKAKQRSVVFEDFVKDVGRTGITIDDLIEMNTGCETGSDFLKRVRDAVIAKGATVGEFEG